MMESKPRLDARRRAKAGRPPGTTFETVVRLGLALPEVEEGLSYGTPALKVQGRLLARLKEDGVTLVLRCDFEEREELLREDGQTFFLTDHYLNYPAVLVRLPRIGRVRLQERLEAAWRFTARPRPAQGKRSRH